MTRSELVALFFQRFPQVVQKDTELAVAEILGAVGSVLSSGGGVEISSFGNFNLNHLPPRICRNPKTGETVSIPAKWTPHIKAGKELRERVESNRP